MAATRLALLQARIRAWNQAHPDRPLDSRAVVAVAAQEGLGGGVGDAGTSFGPFQLHIGGAFPAGVVPSGQEQGWAWSTGGIDYALRHIASVAGGQRGAQAVNSIVSRFERPANIPREIANATRAYGGVTDTVPPSLATVPPSATTPEVAPSLATPGAAQPKQNPDLSALILSLLSKPTPPSAQLSLPQIVAKLPLPPPSAPPPLTAFQPFPKL